MISDAVLTEAAFAVDQAMLDALPKPEECTHIFSRTFEKKMRRLIRRTDHPMVYKVLSRAACALLALVLSAGLFLAFHTEARAAVVDWIKEKIEDFYSYTPPEKDPDAALPGEYYLGWIPEGYTQLMSKTTEDDKAELYVNDAGQILQFHCIHSSSSGSLLLGGGEYKEKKVEIGTMQADLYLSKDNRRSSFIVWPVNNGDVLLHISAHLNETDLIKIAENVFLRENN